jgi:ComF family protein
MKTLFKNFADLFIKSLYPSCPYCPSCGKILFGDEYVICNKCAKIIFSPPLYSCKICGRAVKGGEICNICYENKYSYDRGVCLFVYDKYTSPIIYSIKYGNNTDLAQRLGALLYYDIKRKSDILSDTDIIIAVPMHRDRLNMRGYNQAERIAYGLSSESGIEKRDDILIKTAATADQIGLKKSEREKNLKESFEVADPKYIKNKNILLIDDVLTTGATIDACSGVLKKHGANKVFFAILASKTY